MATNTNIGAAGTELLSLPNMGSVVSTPAGVVSSLGQGIGVNSVFPKLPQLEFYARGVGRNSLVEHVPSVILDSFVVRELQVGRGPWRSTLS